MSAEELTIKLKRLLEELKNNREHAAHKYQVGGRSRLQIGHSRVGCTQRRHRRPRQGSIPDASHGIQGSLAVQYLLQKGSLRCLRWPTSRFERRSREHLQSKGCPPYLGMNPAGERFVEVVFSGWRRLGDAVGTALEFRPPGHLRTADRHGGRRTIQPSSPVSGPMIPRWRYV